MAKLDENGLLYLWQRFKSIFVTKDELSNYGAGDMLRNTYDTDNNGKVDNADNADKLGGQSPSYYAATNELTSYVHISTKGKANGVASLDANGKVPDSQLPEKAPIEHKHEIEDVNGLSTTMYDYMEQVEGQLGTIAEIANGKCTSYVFDTEEDLDTCIADYVAYITNETEMNDLNPFKGKELKTGDIFYIREVEVPDYWWDSNTNSKQILETTKVDLTPITNAEIDEILAT